MKKVLKNAITNKTIKIIDNDSKTDKIYDNDIIVNFSDELIYKGVEIKLSSKLRPNWDEIKKMIMEDDFKEIDGVDIKKCFINYFTITDYIKATIKEELNMLKTINNVYFIYANEEDDKTSKFVNKFKDITINNIVNDIYRRIYQKDKDLSYDNLMHELRYYMLDLADLYGRLVKYAINKFVFILARGVQDFLLEYDLKGAYRYLYHYET